MQKRLSSAPSTNCAAMCARAAPPASASALCRRWARSTPAICRSSTRRVRRRTASSSRFSSIRRSSGRMKISPAIRARLRRMSRSFAASPRISSSRHPVDEIYPPGFSTKVVLEGPATADLEDRFRPTHFSGVATVVTKLLNQAQADVAVFGEKDYQQLLVIKRLARDLDIATEIVGAPNSARGRRPRHVFAQRLSLPRGPRARKAIARRAERSGAAHPCWREHRRGDGRGAGAALTAAGFEVDYLEARHAETLAPVSSLADGPIRLLAAAKLGATRLIDNIAVQS